VTRWILLVSGVRAGQARLFSDCGRETVRRYGGLRLVAAAPRSCAASGGPFRCAAADLRAKKRGPLQAVPVIARAIADRLE
jgi:hypothetical protein